MNALAIRFRKHQYSIKVSKSDGRISLGFDVWLLGEFWSVGAVISHIEEQSRWADGLIRAPKLPKGSVERIENFIRTQPFMLGSES
jgi:hypothetical protein